MPIESPFDPRAALVRTKYFNQYPKPLERWLWKQGLPQAAERVFWLHWSEGKRNGDWCSEIPLKRVALECCIDPSTVTRSYQVLKAKGLIRREDPGRDPENPFCQATAITEVRLPREFLTELSRSPNRPQREASATEYPPVAVQVKPPESRTSVERPAEAATAKAVPGDAIRVAEKSTPHATRRHREETRAMWGRASAAERTSYYTSSRDRLTHLDFDPNTRLTPEDRGHILAQLAQLAAARPPVAKATAPQSGHGSYAGPRHLSVLELARIRKQVSQNVPAAHGQEILRQVLWAVEEGALRRFATPLAINIALKKIREGSWTRPHRMPPNWIPKAAPAGRAVPEQCSAA